MLSEAKHKEKKHATEFLAKMCIEFKAEAESCGASSGAVLLTNNMRTEGCVGGALRGRAGARAS